MLLDRLSNFAVDGNGNLTTAVSNGVIKRSPVWRLIVVEEWPDSRNANPVDDADPDKVPAPNLKEPAAYRAMATAVKSWTPSAAAPIPPFRAADPDFFAAFDRNFVPKQVNTTNLFQIQYPYIEREFYFTTDKSPIVPESMYANADWNYAADKFKLRIPNKSVKISYPATMPPPALGNYKSLSLSVWKRLRRIYPLSRR